jgi:integrase
VDGNLAVARATAAKVAAALREYRPSPLGFERTAPAVLTKGYLDFVTNVQKLAWRTQDRYRAALDRFGEFCAADEITAVDSVDERSVDDFVRWLRGQTRTRNGAKKGKRDVYAVGGVKFILSTCRTAFNWAARRRMLPPYAENPFRRFPIDNLRDVDAPDEGMPIFSPEQQQAFFATCNDWQRGIFQALVTYGMRVGELTHLLIENVDLKAGTIQICSKPELHWRVKTARRRQLPLTREMRAVFEQRIGDRKAGFVFLNEEFFQGRSKPVSEFGSDRAFREKLDKLAADMSAKNAATTDEDRRRTVTAYCRRMGQIPVKRVQLEFCKLTTEIGCPQFTRAHNLRHLFSSRAQEEGMNPLLVQEILGHTTLTMTKRYTHLGMDAKREALERLANDLTKFNR